MNENEFERDSPGVDKLTEDLSPHWRALFAIERVNDHLKVLENKVNLIENLLNSKGGLGERIQAHDVYIEEVKKEVIKQDLAKSRLIEERSKYKWLVLGGIASILVTLGTNFITALKVESIDNAGTTYGRAKNKELQQQIEQRKEE